MDSAPGDEFRDGFRLVSWSRAHSGDSFWGGGEEWRGCRLLLSLAGLRLDSESISFSYTTGFSVMVS